MQPPRHSRPMTCTNSNIDFIGRVLYCAHTARLDDTIRDSGKRVAVAGKFEIGCVMVFTAF